MMRNEKPGGHGERSVAVGVVDMALFDLAAKIVGTPLYRYLSDRHGDGQPDDSVFVYAAGGYYAPGKGLRELQDEMRGSSTRATAWSRCKSAERASPRTFNGSRRCWTSSTVTGPGSPSM
jgi:L-alanine-DL-glutamate epimerase-like enolase superfamily enzyme